MPADAMPKEAASEVSYDNELRDHDDPEGEQCPPGPVSAQ